MNNKRLSIFLFLPVLFVSCKNSGKKISQNVNPLLNKDSVIQIAFNPAEKGQSSQYSYNLSNTTKLEQEINDETVVTENDIAISMRYDIMSDSAKGYKFKITYEDFKLRVKVGDMEKKLQASTADGSVDAKERIFAAFNGAVVTLMLSSDGRASSIQGLDAIKGRMYGYAKGDADAVNMIQSTLQQYLDPSGFKNAFEQTIKIFPAKGIRAGEKWEVSSKPLPDMNVTMPLQYTLFNIENNTGHIGITGAVDFKNQQIQVQGNPVDLSIKGDQKGEVRLDLSTGMVLFSESHFKAKGKMAIMDNEVPVSMEAKTVIQGQKVQ